MIRPLTHQRSKINWVESKGSLVLKGHCTSSVPHLSSFSNLGCMKVTLSDRLEVTPDFPSIAIFDVLGLYKQSRWGRCVCVWGGTSEETVADAERGNRCFCSLNQQQVYFHAENIGTYLR